MKNGARKDDAPTFRRPVTLPIIFREYQFTAIEVFGQENRECKSPVCGDGLPVVTMRPEMRFLVGVMATDKIALHPGHFHKEKLSDFRNYATVNASQSFAFLSSAISRQPPRRPAIRQ